MVQDDYSFYGLWLNGMMSIEDDGTLKNIRRDESELNGSLVCNVFNQCSSKDALDGDLYDFESEERLVYYAEIAERKDVDGDIQIVNKQIKLTFNEKSAEMKDLVVLLMEQEPNVKSVEAVVIPTFVLTDKEAVDAVKEWTSMDLDVKTNSVTYKEEDMDDCYPDVTAAIGHGEHRGIYWHLLSTDWTCSAGKHCANSIHTQGPSDEEEGAQAASYYAIDDIKFDIENDFDHYTKQVNDAIDRMFDEPGRMEALSLRVTEERERIANEDGLEDTLSKEIPF